jgi:hypothetical protein
MAYQRKPLNSPCALCGKPVAEEAIAVRTLTTTLPYTPKIWHRPCYEARPQAAPPPVRQARVACG